MQDLQKNKPLLNEEVDADDIAMVVSKWTGIPVTRMLEGEKGKTFKDGGPTDRKGRWSGRSCQGCI